MDFLLKCPKVCAHGAILLWDVGSCRNMSIKLRDARGKIASLQPCIGSYMVSFSSSALLKKDVHN